MCVNIMDANGANIKWDEGVKFGGWWYSSADFKIDERTFHAGIFDAGEEFIFNVAERKLGGYAVVNQGVAPCLEEAQRLVAAAGCGVGRADGDDHRE